MTLQWIFRTDESFTMPQNTPTTQKKSCECDWNPDYSFLQYKNRFHLWYDWAIKEILVKWGLWLLFNATIWTNNTSRIGNHLHKGVKITAKTQITVTNRLLFLYKKNQTISKQNSALQHSNNSTGHPSAGVSSLERVRVVCFAQIINFSMNHDATAKDRAGAVQGDDRIGEGSFRNAVLIGHNISKISYVTNLIVGGTMWHL